MWAITNLVSVGMKCKNLLDPMTYFVPSPYTFSSFDWQNGPSKLLVCYSNVITFDYFTGLIIQCQPFQNK